MKPRIKYWIYPYGASFTAHDLTKALGGRRLKLHNSQYQKKNSHVLINWGNSHPLPGVTLNKPEHVAIAVSKIETFKKLQAAGIPIPQWTLSNAIANSWTVKGKVLGRDKVTGRGGEGISVYKKGDKVKEHAFYSKYFKKKREFRIHVFNGKIIFKQEKLRKKNVDNVDRFIRSHDRGWCFAFHHLSDDPVPLPVQEWAIRAVAALSLDFGGVDIGWHPDNGCAVFEVNTAPGLEESSLEAYVNAFKEIA